MAHGEKAYLVREVEMVGGSGRGRFFKVPGDRLPEALEAFKEAVAEDPRSHYQVNMTISEMTGDVNDPSFLIPSEAIRFACISNTDGQFYLSVPK